MVKPGLECYLMVAEQNAALYEEQSFEERAEVSDFLDFQFTEQHSPLKHRAEKLKANLEAIDSNLFQKLRREIRTKNYRGKDFKKLVGRYVGLNENDNAPGYNNLDIFINGLISARPLPEQTKELEAEMVFYQKTPARIVFELVEKAQFSANDIFFDLGSGLGQVAILVHLLSGITVKGVEFEPAFCNYAQDCTAGLNLPEVIFINTDARKADYSDGTVFFLFTPFSGEILQSVLELLRNQSLRRKIKIITYGPCTAQVALQSWLEFRPPIHNDLYQLAFFYS